MPMTGKRFGQIRRALDRWRIVDAEHTTDAALQEMFKEMRTVLEELVEASTEDVPSLWERIRGVFVRG